MSKKKNKKKWRQQWNDDGVVDSYNDDSDDDRKITFRKKKSIGRRNWRVCIPLLRMCSTPSLTPCNDPTHS